MIPQRLDGRFAWIRLRFEDSNRWQFESTQADIDDIARAVDTARAAGRCAHEVRREDFPLPVLGAKLAATADELANGCGVVRVFGLPIDRYDEASIELLWMGIGRHLGALRSQEPPRTYPQAHRCRSSTTMSSTTLATPARTPRTRMASACSTVCESAHPSTMPCRAGTRCCGGTSRPTPCGAGSSEAAEGAGTRAQDEGASSAISRLNGTASPVSGGPSSSSA